MSPAVRLDGVFVRYPGATVDALQDVDLTLEPGQVVLVTGRSGCGKSTLVRLVNGLIPHLHEATVRGIVEVTGLRPAEHELHAMGRIVSTVFQNPRTQFFCADSTAELAFAGENAGLAPQLIRERIRTVTTRLGMTQLLDRRMAHLSGGQKQQIAIAAAAVNEPRIHVLDEPTSNLDDTGVLAVQQLLGQLRTEGATVLIAEHRLAFLRHLVDRVIVLEQGRVRLDLPAAEFYAMDESRRRRLGLRQLHEPRWQSMPPASAHHDVSQGLSVSDLVFRHGRGLDPVLDLPSLQLPRGKVTVITGRNGAGKSTLVRVLSGLSRPTRGTILLDGRPIHRRALLQRSHVVMQDVNRQLFFDTVHGELTNGVTATDVTDVLQDLGLAGLQDHHPMALSGGQRQRVAVAAAVTADSDLVFFDEPTSGLDRDGMHAIGELLHDLAADNRIVAVVTHDRELAAECGDVVLPLGTG
ncbi:ATP-binding cassette domain-containing protein [Arachnia propionica]|uniref:ATP-binding cassette domain-containing protein n=1 Tax=Arachnia propionica TaxID=1750 RepID=A0A3P1T9Q9_9ACTN|nr:ABC transporter ATP-binding protein [Arachnia propionica]RRD06028.1 ATP-binding cassette domain-containing protein [Arachnia propionica]